MPAPGSTRCWRPTNTEDEVVHYSLLGEGKRLRADPGLRGARSSQRIFRLPASPSSPRPWRSCMLFAGSRRPPVHGQRRSAARAADGAPRVRRAAGDARRLRHGGAAARVLAHGLAMLTLPDARRREIALELFRAAGAGGNDRWAGARPRGEAKALPMEALEDVHRRKTGALIAASCVIGGLSADSSPRHVGGLRAYGEAMPRLSDCRRRARRHRDL